MATANDQRDTLYVQVADEFGNALVRLAHAYEPDPDLRRDLLQDIHFELWRSLLGFDGKCSMRTWVYRVAHNVGISRRLRKRKLRLLSLEELDEEPLDPNSAYSNERAADEAHNVARLHELIRQLVPPDSQVMMLYLEDMDAVSIGEITGLSARAVATRVHRIKAILARRFRGAFRE